MNILIFAKNWLGDILFEVPAMRALKRHYPDAHLMVVAPPRCLDMLRANPLVNEVILFDERGDEKSLSAQWKFVQKLKSKKIDRAYFFHRSATRAFLVWLSGAKERIGYDTKGRGFFLTVKVPEPKERQIHDVHYFLELIKASGVPVREDARYEFFFHERNLSFVQLQLAREGIDLSRIVALNPGANWLPKRWPAEHFGALAKKLVDRYGVQVVITGSEQDEALAETIRQQAKGYPVFSFCGQTTLLELGALFSLCKLVVSNDSGPLHIASGVGVPVIGIFGPTDPKRTGPMGTGRNTVVHYVPEGEQAPWFGKEFPYDKWLKQLSPDQIIETIDREKLIPLSPESKKAKHS